ncbi:MAG: methylenetetrahydrofolate reductase [Deltaproteobacteria bacterium]|nr:methylenetetrahydrofolate reductase [Deltaproteobacteria bacterium]MBW2076409.1 methylenetetrahydrofolate reductase [Deltaproteobacteria bacterium]MBW2310651.1 methylenetetrahydrofolate reductase [Deltaproteobacteria bacterium]
MALRESLESGKFAITTEVGPLKGTDTSEIVELAEILNGTVDGVNVTDQQSAVMRLGSLATCSMLVQRGLDPVFQMTCRDRNRIALQSDLLSAAVLGIRNVLVISGDFPSLGDHIDAKDVYDLDSEQLIWTISQMNDGYDLSGTELKGKTDLFVGAVVKPVSDTEESSELQLAMMEKKISVGARFFQTQAVYDVDAFEKFMKRASQFKVPVLVGIIPLKSAGMARYMNKNVSGVFVPEHMISDMAKAEDKTATGLGIAASLIKDLKDLCQGVHIMAIGWEKKVPEILRMANLS